MQTYYLETIISALFLLVVAMMAYWLKRSDQRITALEQRLDEIIKNYLDRFDDVKDTIYAATEKINTNLAEVNADIKEIAVTVKNLTERVLELNRNQE